MYLKQFQEEMVKAIGNLKKAETPDAKFLSMLIAPDPLNSSQKLNPIQALGIYRENIFQSLKEALENRFPLSRLLLGAEYFSQISKMYIENFPCKKARFKFLWT